MGARPENEDAGATVEGCCEISSFVLSVEGSGPLSCLESVIDTCVVGNSLDEGEGVERLAWALPDVIVSFISDSFNADAWIESSMPSFLTIEAGSIFSASCAV